MKLWRDSNRAGQSLVEFAVVSLVLYLLLAAILTFGHMLYVAQGLQSAADLAAREISRTPFHALHPTETPSRALTFEDVTTTAPGFSDNDAFRKKIFDEAFLVIDLDEFYLQFPTPSNGAINVFQHLVPTLPLLNQQLIPLMVVDRPVIDQRVRRFLRYPGALLRRQEEIRPPSGSTFTTQGPYESDTSYKGWIASEFAIQIPLIIGQTGSETIQLLKVIEEIKAVDADSPFRIDSEQRGIVALRINYPFQSASMSSFRHLSNAPTFPFEPTIGRVNVASNALSSTNPSDNAVVSPLLLGGTNGEEVYAGTHGGKYGLGAQGAFGQVVRPYRRVITAQAIYRREIFDTQ